MVNAEVLQRDGAKSFQVKRDVSMCEPTIDLNPMVKKNLLKKAIPRPVTGPQIKLLPGQTIFLVVIITEKDR
jgi:hypothetical protein